MWLDNYYKIMYTFSAYDAQSYYSVNISHNPMRSTNGTAREYVSPPISYRPNFTRIPYNGIASQLVYDYSSYYNYPNLVVGSGTTPVSVSDYCLENEITSLTSSTVKGTYDPIDGTVTYRKTMVNTSSESITVSEIGLVSYATNYGSATATKNGTTFPFLYFREVLDEPIVVPSGDTFTVTITHKFTMPE